MNKITILLIEDNPKDVRLIKELLKEISSFNYTLISSGTLKDGCEQIKNNNPDLILLDLNLPDSMGYQTFAAVTEISTNVPIILVSGLEDEELSLKLIKEGAQDYITKQKLNNSLLDKVILYSIERKRTEMELKKMAEKWRATFNSITDIICIISKDHEFIEINKAGCDSLGLERKDIIGKKCFELVHHSDQPLKHCPCSQVIAEKAGKTQEIFENGRYFQLGAWPIFNEKSEFIAFTHTIKDVTTSKEAEISLQQSHDMIMKLTNQVPGVVYQYRLFPDGRSCFPFSSAGMETIYEVTPEEVKDDATPVFSRLHPDDYNSILETIMESARTQTLYHSEFRVVLPRQGLRWRLCDAKPELMDDGSTLWHGIISDITERKLIEKAIKEKSKELERFNDVMVGRELKMVELKKEINGLLKRLGEKDKYLIVEEGN